MGKERENILSGSINHVVIILLLGVLVQCTPEPQTTEIIEIQVEPGHVKTEYIAELLCLVSADDPEDFVYHWSLQSDDGLVVDTVTQTNRFYYKAPATAGEYSHSVTVFDKRGNLAAPEFKFVTPVIQDDWVPIDPFFEEIDMVIQKSQHEIFVSNSETGESRLIAMGHNPYWSPEGKRIMYRGWWEDEECSGKICVMNIDGTGKQSLTWRHQNGGLVPEPFGIGNMNWSPNGQKVAFRISSAAGIFLVNVDPEYNFVRDQVTFNSTILFDWHPNMAKFLQSENESIYITGISGENKNIVIDVEDRDKEGLRIREAKFSPDGNKIAYLIRYIKTLKDSSNKYYREEFYDLNIINTDGSSPVNIISWDDTKWRVRPRSLSWSPDGDRISLVLNYNETPIVTVNVSLSEKDYLIENKEIDYEIEWLQWRPTR